MNFDGLPPAQTDPDSSGLHLASLSHAGRFWDVYIEFVDDPRRPDTCRALLCFSPADRAAREGPVRTTTIIIESSYAEAVERARQLEERQLVGLLRSCLPD